MSESTETPKEDKEKKKAAERDRDQSMVPVVPKHLKLFEWLEGLFYTEPETANFPEKLTLNPMSGPQTERVAKNILQRIYGPGGEPKPPRSKLTGLANEIYHRAQQDCDVQRKSTKYGVLVYHFSREDGPYEVFRFRLEPGPAHVGEDQNGVNGEDDELSASLERRFSLQVLEHDERMFSLYGGGVEGLLDRYAQDKERDAAEIDRLRKECRELRDQLERALSLQEERDERRAWMNLKVQYAGRAAETGFALVPPLLHRALGGFPGAGGAPAETMETITLRNFFQPKEKGGVLTQEQLNTITGHYGPGPDFALISSGIFSYEQAKLLWDVAHLRVPADELDRLLPSGNLAISSEQFSRLQQCGVEQMVLAPLYLIFEMRMSRAQSQDGVPNGVGQK